MDDSSRETAAGAAELAARIDHTLLAAGATPAAIERLCEEALAHGFANVCVAGTHVARCAEALSGSGVGVVAVAGFPLGNAATAVKVFETARAADDGATEVDVVAALGRLLADDDRAVLAELEEVVLSASALDARVKVILETGLLDPDRIARGCRLARSAGAEFVKTSTGFGPRGATVEDVRLMRATVGSEMGVKAAGGIRDAATARALLEAGADRLGCSASLAVIGVADSNPKSGQNPPGAA